MFPNATFRTLNLITLTGFCAAHDLTASFFFLFSLVLGLNTLSPWGLGFLHGICMTGWVNSAHTPLTHSGLDEFFSVNSAFCLINAQHLLSVHVCAFYVLSCVCLCVGCIVSSPVLDPHNLLPSPSVPFLPFPLSAPFWLRCFRRHPQTHSGIFTQSGHDPKWPAAPQTGVHRFGLVTGQPCRQ